MAPTIHLVRHAEGVHNLCTANEAIRDPDLTERGEEQCAMLRKGFGAHERVGLLLASPMRRTLHTCILAFGTERLLPVRAVDVLQEMSGSACDTGSSVEALRREFGPETVDLSAVGDGWADKGAGSPFEPAPQKLLARGRAARRAIREAAGEARAKAKAKGGGEDDVVVVSHGAFLHFLTDAWEGIPEGRATSWANCECRSYQFADPTGGDDDATLVETAESWARRHGPTAVRPSGAEQRALRELVMKRIVPCLMDPAAQ